MNKKYQNALTQMPNQWWARSAKILLEVVDVQPTQGLDSERVLQSRHQFGDNQWEQRGPTPLWALIWDSVKSPMILVLLSIAGISLALGQTREAIVMGVVVSIYIAVHLLNKARSDRTMAKLREVQALKTLVLREGKKQEIDFKDVVVGDVLPLRAGGRIPADARLISSVGLLVDESTLTGESQPVRKKAQAEIAPTTSLADRKTAVFAGTTVRDGQGKALVMAVGEKTELGRVAELSTREETEKTPLQKEMDDLAKTLAYVAVGVSLLIPLIGWFLGFDMEQMVLTWLSLTFLMVPGQPPIIIAMALALASLELSHKKVIVRRLHGAETLGSVDVVVSDKTGTMTENTMKLSQILISNGDLIEVEDDKLGNYGLQFFQIAQLSIPETTHDPTDVAVLDAAESVISFEPDEVGKLIDLVGFSGGGEFRNLVYENESRGVYQFLAGRPEFLLNHADHKMVVRKSERSTEPFLEDEKEKLLDKLDELAKEGKRLVAYAYKEGEAQVGQPHDLTFAGVGVIIDPVRPEVESAIEVLSQAGVRTMMVTGDKPETAVYVAQEVGLDASRVITGDALEKASDDERAEWVEGVFVFARTTPEQKFQLVKALQKQGKTVAVTGDGINDAPALNTAHIGVAMGEKGTDVAKESADLILTDDNFAHLPDGVAIGRKAYDNFRKGITYYLSAKAILLSIFIIPLIAGVDFPLAPIQIIFTELLMDLASSTIFITEKAEPDVMRRSPRQRSRFLSWKVGGSILRNMIGLTSAILVVYFGSLTLGYGVDSARTAAFSTWLLGHIVLALNLKQQKTPLFKQGLFSNTFAIGWLIGMIALVIGMTHWDILQSVLHTTRLSPLQWGGVVLGSLLASMWMEVLKWVKVANKK